MRKKERERARARETQVCKRRLGENFLFLEHFFFPLRFFLRFSFPRSRDQRGLGLLLLGREGVGSGVVGGGRSDDGRWHSLATLQVFALIHGQATSASTEAVSLRAELATVADFAK